MSGRGQMVGGRRLCAARVDWCGNIRMSTALGVVQVGGRDLV